VKMTNATFYVLSTYKVLIVISHFHCYACSLPAVPNLEEVPDISFQCPVESVRSELEQTLSHLGQVSKMGPVQVTEVDEKPGALLVRWEEV
jgi:hypothetical protein